MSFTPIVFLIMLSSKASNNEEIQLPFYVGIAVEIMYLVYFGMIGYLFWSGTRTTKDNKKRHLYRIWTSTTEGISD